MIEWWGEDGLYHVTKCTGDLCPGGKWRSEGVDVNGKSFAVEGEYLKVEPPRYLCFTWRHDWEENTAVTTVELEFQKTAEGTLLKLKHHGFTSESSRDDHEKGWKRVLGWLRGYMEKKSALRATRA
jgi:uncharacterized protein YndB with AHSA1/START domain